MHGKTYSSDAIILSIKNYGEADKLLVLFTKKYGKVSVIAKGSRKPSSRKRGALQIFNVVRCVCSKQKAFDVLNDVSIIESFDQIKLDLKKSSVAYFLLEVITKLTQFNEPNESIYSLLQLTLQKLAITQELKQTRYEFTRQILVLLGFWPAGKPLSNPDYILEEVAERQFSSIRVGKKLLS